MTRGSEVDMTESCPIYGTSEDAYTLTVAQILARYPLRPVMSDKLEDEAAIANGLYKATGLQNVKELWYRPSFGRGIGTGSGFGEPDLVVIGEDGDRSRRVVFVEAKSVSITDAGISGEKNLSSYELVHKNHDSVSTGVAYQLALKFALATLIWSGEGDGAHAVEPPKQVPNTVETIGEILSLLYLLKGGGVRKEPWRIEPPFGSVERLISAIRDCASGAFLGLLFVTSDSDGGGPLRLWSGEVPIPRKPPVHGPLLYQSFPRLLSSKKSKETFAFPIEILQGDLGKTKRWHLMTGDQAARCIPVIAISVPGNGVVALMMGPRETAR